MDIQMHHPNPLWPSRYEKIASQLRADMSAAKMNFISIIHIGSTSIPNLNAKPIIDILITIPPDDFADPKVLPFVVAALRDGDEQGGYYYIGNGGLRERWSFKLGIREDIDGVPVMPHRNVYVVPDGGIHHRSTVAFRDCLRKEENSDLREEYGQLKWALAEGKDFVSIWDYADQKTTVIRKVLKRAGWSDEEIMQREEMRVKNWPDALII